MSKLLQKIVAIFFLVFLSHMPQVLAMQSSVLQTETPDQIRDRALQSGHLQRTIRPLEAYVQYFKKDFFSDPQERTNPGHVALGILGGVSIEPLLQDDAINASFINMVCYNLALLIENATDEKRSMAFVRAMVDANKVTIHAVQEYCMSHAKDSNREKIAQFNLITQRPRILQQWCAGQSWLTQKTICVAVLGTAALAVSTKLAYKKWATRNQGVVRSDLKITIQNDTELVGNVTLYKNDGATITTKLANSCHSNGRWTGDVKDIDVVFFVGVSPEGIAFDPLKIHIASYKTHRYAESADLQIVIKPVTGLWRFWYRSPYRYEIKWQKFNKF